MRGHNLLEAPASECWDQGHTSSQPQHIPLNREAALLFVSSEPFQDISGVIEKGVGRSEMGYSPFKTAFFAEF